MEGHIAVKVTFSTGWPPERDCQVWDGTLPEEEAPAQRVTLVASSRGTFWCEVLHKERKIRHETPKLDFDSLQLNVVAFTWGADGFRCAVNGVLLSEVPDVTGAPIRIPANRSKDAASLSTDAASNATEEADGASANQYQNGVAPAKTLPLKRKQILLAPEAIIPARYALWEAAREKLKEAALAVDSMRAARDRIAFERAFADFAEALNVAWHRFYDEGKTVYRGKFSNWAEDFVKMRDEDSLLRYLREARHKTQHERLQLVWSEPFLQITGNSGFNLHSLEIAPDGSYSIAATTNEHKENADARVVYLPGRPMLPTIKNRGIVYAPPDKHLGMPLAGKEPIDIAVVAFGFYDKCIQDAYAAFQNGTGT